MKQINLKQIIDQFRKNKFFSFLSLFGISIPIMIVMIIVLQVDLSIHPGGPEKDNDEMLFIHRTKIHWDHGGHGVGGVHQGIIEHYFREIAPPGCLAFSYGSSKTLYREKEVLDIALRYTNAGFWQLFDFNFLQGRSYSLSNVKNGDNVVVISSDIRDKLFDEGEVVGQMLELGEKTYRVIGVVEEVSSICRNTYAQIWLPYTLGINLSKEIDLNATGRFMVTFKSTDEWDFKTIKQQVAGVRSKLNNMNDENVELIFGGPATADEIYFRAARDPEKYEGTFINYLGIAGKALLILFLPALNLVSLNLTRIQERSHEIAIRKAFGATKKNMAWQVMVENALLTVMGGLIGLALAYIGVMFFKEQIFSQYFVGDATQVMVHMNYTIFIAALLISLFFSLLSGLIPSLRISRLQPAYVLKGGEL